MSDSTPGKRKLTACACEPCRVAKVKCDGQRPVCQRCRVRNQSCTFATNEGQTRQQAMRQAGIDAVDKINRYDELAKLLYGRNDPEFLDQVIRRLKRPSSSAGRASGAAAPAPGSGPPTHTAPGLVHADTVMSGTSDPDQKKPSPMVDGVDGVSSPGSNESFYGDRDMDLESHLNATEPLLRQKNYSGPSASSRNAGKADAAGTADAAMLDPLLSWHVEAVNSKGSSHVGADYTSMPLHDSEDSSSMSIMYLSFRNASRDAIFDGTPPRSIMGNLQTVDVTSMFQEGSPREPYTADNWACQVLQTQNGRMDQFVLLAWVSLLTRFMRWMILPTAETFEHVPKMIRPLPSQRQRHHIANIDLCPHPALREILMKNYRPWIQPQAAGDLSVWPGKLEGAIFRDPSTGRTILTPEFEQWVWEATHWKFSRALCKLFPEAEAFGMVFVD